MHNEGTQLALEQDWLARRPKTCLVSEEEPAPKDPRRELEPDWQVSREKHGNDGCVRYQKEAGWQALGEPAGCIAKGQD